MRRDLPIELRRQDDHVLATARQLGLIEIAVVRDARLAHEVETYLVEYGRNFQFVVGAEKDGGAEHSLEGLDQAPILRSALLHAERVQHLSAAVERNGAALPPNGQSGEVERHEAVLPPGQSVIGMAGHLQ